ncbi:nuclear transport factor 2 family protein [Bradyrhizobium tropiciagri]|uniref:nuclear transport factor 2 family protein n=1 Tax=Bradyrhizobium tropiciagri TaxID=312253 RepID=UPI001BA516E1|nr:nuclear transport factor 2 family protein [Bradyrhizobium tropiciagri]MBR0899934.1 nuclear transport factor 2 family protein [Bradyrhizobium tropiciagri]
MPSPTAKEIVLNAWQTFRTRDASQIAALFAPDAEWIAPARNATAVALDHTDHMVGADAIAHFISTEMHRLFSEIDIAFRAVHADGNNVIVEERMRATLPGGRAYDNDYCFVFVVEDGRIKQVREYMDTRKGWQMVFGEAAA